MSFYYIDEDGNINDFPVEGLKVGDRGIMKTKIDPEPEEKKVLIYRASFPSRIDRTVFEANLLKKGLIILTSHTARTFEIHGPDEFPWLLTTKKK